MTLSTFEGAIHRIEQYRICLERDAEAGIISGSARPCVDECYRTLESVLRSARIEMEAAGAAIASDRDFSHHFIGGCSMLALRMFRCMYREDAERLERSATAIRAEGRALMEHLWAWLESVAA